MSDVTGRRDTHVTLRLQGDEIPALALLQALESLVRLLQTVGGDAIVAENAPVWIVQSFASGSTIITLRPAGDRAAIGTAVTTVGWTLAGLDALEAAQPLEEIPPHFSASALEDVRRLLSTAQQCDTIDALSVSAPEADVTLTARALANVEALVGSRYAAYTSVDGLLQIVSVRGGLHVSVRDGLTGEPVRCSIPDERVPDVVAAFNRRVSVFGLGRYSQHHQLLSITVEEVRILPAEGELPTTNEVIGLVSDLTGGLTSEEFVRSLRDAG